MERNVKLVRSTFKVCDIKNKIVDLVLIFYFFQIKILTAAALIYLTYPKISIGIAITILLCLDQNPSHRTQNLVTNN